jgi:hypothetical protein
MLSLDVSYLLSFPDWICFFILLEKKTELLSLY